MNNCYFSHDSNARNSKKILRLRKALGAEGYGTYFMLLERLREEQDYTCDADYEMLTYDLRVNADVIKSVVEDFGLFELNADKTRFHSVGFDDRMAVKEQRSVAGKKGMEKRWGQKDENPSGITPDNGSITDAITKSVCYDFVNNTPSDKEKKSKEKESKENYYCSSLTPPTAGAVAGAEEQKEQQQKDFLYDEKIYILLNFFLKSYQHPQQEYAAMVDYNNLGGRDWSKMDHKQRMAAANRWAQKPPKPPRFDKTLTDLWYNIIVSCMNNHAPEDVILSMLSDGIDLKIKERMLTLYCPEPVCDYIEEQNMDNIRPILMQYKKLLSIDNLQYQTI